VFLPRHYCLRVLCRKGLDSERASEGRKSLLAALHHQQEEAGLGMFQQVEVVRSFVEEEEEEEENVREE
jgi:hypothetical protein